MLFFIFSEIQSFSEIIIVEKKKQKNKRCYELPIHNFKDS